MVGVAEERLADVHAEWIEAALASGRRSREPQWSEAVAVGRRAFVEDLQRRLGVRARYRQIAEADGVSVLREAAAVYDAVSRSKWAA